ncbi:MerR family transcriptional regulator [Mesobacillus boroniphilus]|uniref:MerR family transcriptional regulator n=1 Tax=Mesobacillus boroniphilus TaxID=308892 RepID=A0A944CPP8_9BACI|nr:MerR family transcriptional regulator [Mesobacillus boroniphilus]MBS8266326.1 MerR family transcriptional regulator [Mesobacillus boroniphilus]
MYSIKQVSELLDIPAVTIRAWENRYTVVTPTRTEGGHRLYNEKDLETLKWIKTQVHEKNMKISDAVRLLRESPPAPASPPHVSDKFEELTEQLYQALVSLDTQEANRIADLAFSLYDYEEVFHHILVQVLYKVGDEWETGTISVAQEHFSSQFIINRCTQFLRVLPVNHALPKVLAFCPEGEHHQIGLMVFSLFLKKKGNDVIYLGPNTPLEGLEDLMKMRNISVVAISMTNPAPVKTVENWIQSCLETNTSLKFIIGGSCVHDCPKLESKSVTYSLGFDWDKWYESFMRG